MHVGELPIMAEQAPLRYWHAALGMASNEQIARDLQSCIGQASGLM
jgi:hypothetical protein